MVVAENAAVMMRPGFLDKYERVYDTFQSLPEVGGQGQARESEKLEYLAYRVLQDAGMTHLLEETLKTVGKRAASIKSVTDLAAGECRYILALDGVFPNLASVELVDTDPSRIKGANARIRNWVDGKERFKVVDCDLKEIGSNSSVSHNRDLVLLKNPDLLKDEIWQDIKAFGRVLNESSNLLSRRGIFVYAGRLREFARYLGMPARLGLEFQAVEAIDNSLGVKPFVVPQPELSSFGGITYTNYIVIPLNARKAREFGRLITGG